MKYKRYIIKITGILICICFMMSVMGCGILGDMMQPEQTQESTLTPEEIESIMEATSEYLNSQEQEPESEEVSYDIVQWGGLEENSKDTMSYTVQQKVTYEVDRKWTLSDTEWGAFFDENEEYLYQVLMIYYLGEHTVDSFYEYFLSECEKSGEGVNVVTQPEPFVTADGLDAYVGRVEMETNGLFHIMDVLIIPDKNIAVILESMSTNDEAPDTDIREITETVTIPYGNEDYITGYTFTTNYGTEIVLDEYGEYKEYSEAGNYDGQYSTGTYEVFYGDEAIEELVAMDIGFEADVLNHSILTNGNGHRLGYGHAPAYLEGETEVDENYYHVCKDTFCTIVTKEDWIVKEDGTREKGQGFYVVRVCFYLYEVDTLDIANAHTGDVEQWYRQ